MVKLATKQSKEDIDEVIRNTTDTPKTTPINGSSTNRDNDDDIDNDIKDVTLGDFSKFVRIQDSLEKQIEKRTLRNQPGISFGEKLGMKIEEKVSDGFIDKMLGNMFTTGSSTTKPDGWLAIVKTVLDSGFAQHAGANLHLTIESLGKTIGKQKTDQLADAVVQAVGPKKSPEDEQRKMEEFVLSLNPVNIVDVKKFMDLVNANPANNKVTDINQARNILIEEQDRIRRDNPMLAESVGKRLLEENPDIDRGDRGQKMRPPMGQRDNFMDSMMPRDTGTAGAGNSNQMTSEQILALDPSNNDSVTSYAWSQGHGQKLQEPNGLNKVKNIMMRHQDDLMKQVSGLGGGQQPSGVEQSTDTETVVGIDNTIDAKWDEEDIGKKRVGRMDKKGEIVVPPHIESADSPVTKVDNVKENQSSSPSETQMAQNSIMELLQKMANNFDTNMNEINDKLQMMEKRIVKVESTNIASENVITEDLDSITVEEKEEKIVDEISEPNLQEETEIEDDLQDDQKIEDDLQEEQKIEDVKSNIPVISTKDETWWKNKKDDTEDVKDKKSTSSIVRENDSTFGSSNTDLGTSTPKKHEKGSIGWLKEQKRLKEQKKLK